MSVKLLLHFYSSQTVRSAILSKFYVGVISCCRNPASEPDISFTDCCRLLRRRAGGLRMCKELPHTTPALRAGKKAKIKDGENAEDISSITAGQPGRQTLDITFPAGRSR